MIFILFIKIVICVLTEYPFRFNYLFFQFVLYSLILNNFQVLVQENLWNIKIRNIKKLHFYVETIILKEMGTIQEKAKNELSIRDLVVFLDRGSLVEDLLLDRIDMDLELSENLVSDSLVVDVQLGEGEGKNPGDQHQCNGIEPGPDIGECVAQSSKLNGLEDILNHDDLLDMRGCTIDTGYYTAKIAIDLLRINCKINLADLG